MKFLLIEMLACLVAASVLGLIIGWLLKTAFAREQLLEREAAWSDKQLQLEADLHQHATRADTPAGEWENRIAGLNEEKRSLEEALTAHRNAIASTRAELDELNGNYHAMENRLDAIIRQKDAEILHLQREIIASSNALKAAESVDLDVTGAYDTAGSQPQGSAGGRPAGGRPAGGRPDASEFDQTQVLGERPAYHDPLRKKD